jgi:hypothetical protein
MASTAGNTTVTGIFTQQRLRQGTRKFDLADALPAMNQVRMRKLFATFQDFL